MTSSDGTEGQKNCGRAINDHLNVQAEFDAAKGDAHSALFQT